MFGIGETLFYRNTLSVAISSLKRDAKKLATKLAKKGFKFHSDEKHGTFLD